MTGAAGGAERVLLVGGGDEATDAAVDWVLERAARHPIELEVLAVSDGRHDGGLARTEQRIRSRPGAPAAHVVLAAGDPRNVIASAGATRDLLVLGTNRVSALTRHLPPTFAPHLAESAPCPVVLVPSGWTGGDGPVLVGVSGDGTDTAATAFAVREAQERRRPLELVHAWRMSQVVTPVFPWALDDAPKRREHADLLSRIADDVRAEDPRLDVQEVLVHGQPSTELVRASAGAELVVVGSDGYGPVDRVLLRSVGRALAERPTCPVAIVPPARP